MFQFPNITPNSSYPFSQIVYTSACTCTRNMTYKTGKNKLETKLPKRIFFDRLSPRKKTRNNSHTKPLLQPQL